MKDMEAMCRNSGMKCIFKGSLVRRPGWCSELKAKVSREDGCTKFIIGGGSCLLFSNMNSYLGGVRLMDSLSFDGGVFPLTRSVKNIILSIVRQSQDIRQTNGMVERFNGRIKQGIITTRFKNAEELRETLMAYLYTYNHLLPQRILNGPPPIETLSEYYKSHPQIFKTNPANLTEPDKLINFMK